MLNKKLTTKDEIESWINRQQWYQKIYLTNGLVTPGNIDSAKRLKFLNGESLSNKSVLDIGCNSGYYCLWAKKQGAARVVGVDIDENRLEQARILAEIEGLDIEYYAKEMSGIGQWGHFDVVFCFAVLTEIRDLVGALGVLNNVLGQKAYIEMALAKPILYLSRSSHWLKGLFKKRYSYGALEIRPTKRGWTMIPSIRVVRDILGDQFRIVYLGKGLRYDMISVERI